MLIVAALSATVLASTKALVAPSPAAAWPGGCQTKQKVAFIGFPGINGLEDMQAPLRSLRKLWPVKALAFRYTTSPLTFSGPGLDTLVDEVEARVNYLEAHGFNRIGLPSVSSFLVPFIYGTGGSLGGVNLQTRHPNTVFVTINNGTSAVDDLAAASNVFRFVDVPSSNDSLEPAIDALVGPSGQLLILYQEGDAVSESVRDQYLAIAGNLGITSTAMAMTYNGSDFDEDMPAAKSALDALPAGSLVVHAVNGNPNVQDAYETSALNASIFVDSSTNGAIRHFGGNFFPSTGLPVALEFGYSPVDQPTWQSTRAGFPTNYQNWFDDQRSKGYMDAFGFLAKCGKFHGILDGFLRFDEGGTRINLQLERVYLPADSLTFTPAERIDNPRWDAEQYAWDWNAVFGE